MWTTCHHTAKKVCCFWSAADSITCPLKCPDATLWYDNWHKSTYTRHRKPALSPGYGSQRSVRTNLVSIEYLKNRLTSLGRAGVLSNRTLLAVNFRLPLFIFGILCIFYIVIGVKLICSSEHEEVVLMESEEQATAQLEIPS